MNITSPVRMYSSTSQLESHEFIRVEVLGSCVGVAEVLGKYIKRSTCEIAAYIEKLEVC